MKRPSIHLMDSSSCNNADELLGQSLKRVRISTSPGELRLDRDLQQLGWSTSNRFLTDHIWLDRVHALRLVLMISNRIAMHIDIPRMYPHEAPKLVRVVQEDERDSDSSRTPSSSSSLQLPDYAAWSPIQTIQDYIQYLLEQLSMQSESDIGMAVDEIHNQPLKHVAKSLFAPNRFDVGYDRSIPAKAMEC